MMRTAEELDRILRLAWLFVTPLGLVMAAVILLTRLVIKKRWRSRMARASALLITSYAVLMVRVLAGYNNAPQGGERGPDPWFAAFYTFAACYFLYALFIEWALPAMIWLVRFFRGRQQETLDELDERIENA